MRVFIVIFATLIALSWTKLAVAESAVFHVAANGADAWSGTKATHEGTGDAGPFHTLARARCRSPVQAGRRPVCRGRRCGNRPRHVAPLTN